MNSAVLSSLLALSFINQSPARPHAPGARRVEQRAYSAEDSNVRRPVRIPAAVLRMLAQDEVVSQLLKYMKIPPERLPRSWFTCSAIHLFDKKHVDLIIIGQRPVAGANVTTFWVFRDLAGTYEKALSAQAHDLEVLSTKTNGYREIELSGATSVQYTSEIFYFDGKLYVPK